MSDTSVVLFHSDLRLSDHSALTEAVKSGNGVLLVYILETALPRSFGSASKWWLHHSLSALDNDLRENFNSRLIVLQGNTIDCLKQLHSELEFSSIYSHSSLDPNSRFILDQVALFSKKSGVKLSLIDHPFDMAFIELSTSQGAPYQVYTPFSKAFLNEFDKQTPPLSRPKTITSPDSWPNVLSIEDLDLLPKIRWDSGFYPIWSPGEEGAREKVAQFIQRRAAEYSKNRNTPSVDGVSKMAAHLHFGEISIRELRSKLDLSRHFAYYRQIIWKLFSQYVLFHFPHSQQSALKPKWDHFPYTFDQHRFNAWCKGKTGYPMVDAGMRELWTTGYMHNRTRMIVASFLTKHLGISWKHGEEWFWDTLVDADIANNVFGWQWTAGCGADASPYFRIFNPITQGSKFDPDAHYIRKWIPELEHCPKEHIFEPWKWTSSENHYPAPIVDHSEARSRALADYDHFKILT